MKLMILIKQYQTIARTDAEEQVKLGIRKGKINKDTGAVEEVGEVNKTFLHKQKVN